MMFRAPVVGDLLKRTAVDQERRDHVRAAIKLQRKARAAEKLRTLLPHGGSVVDIGGEEWYHPSFEEQGFRAHSVNYPVELQTWWPSRTYDAASAMHVLEHTLFPAYILAAIKAAAPILWVAVPHATPTMQTWPGHFTVLTPDGWARLLRHTGWEIVYQESAHFGGPEAVEEGFLCRAVR